ncbi:unnamed protein product [Acanthoscelides obtectus]|uniref:Uncharacterized protein n=1 Tax=Acanthoscelides obtectus TaxID=200917 RepID=A0A9P0M5F7_ACAOB|nr:unnamed protein product [Acanthoscelides obtectus]CAK1649177.1 hypothetical protein AOBTE_LOCUS16084 [Acanthoscelides obtectus]
MREMEIYKRILVVLLRPAKNGDYNYIINTYH